MQATAGQTGLLERVRSRLILIAAWRPARQGAREALALLAGTAVIWMTMWGADEIGARLAA